MTIITPHNPNPRHLGTVIQLVAGEYIPSGCVVGMGQNSKCIRALRGATPTQFNLLGVALNTAQPGEMVDIAGSGSVCLVYYESGVSSGEYATLSTIEGAVKSGNWTTDSPILGFSLEAPNSGGGSGLAYVYIRPQYYCAHD